MRPLRENLDDERIVDALVTCPTRDEAARSLGVSPATLYRWLQQDEDLRKAEREVRAFALSDATASIHRLANEATLTLSVIMKSDSAPFSSRVAAASKLLDMAYRSFELENVVEELDRLKADLNL